MAYVWFNKICRACLTSNGARAIQIFTSNIEEYKSKPEYEFSKVLESSLAKGNIRCEFCGSPFIEGTEIEIGDYKLYDFDRLVTQCKNTNGELFIWQVVKQNGRIEISQRGKNTHDPLFIRECFIAIIKLIDNFPEDKLLHHGQIGDFLISFTGNYDSRAKSFSPIIQRLWCSGLSRYEITKCMNLQLGEFKNFDLVREV